MHRASSAFIYLLYCPPTPHVHPSRLAFPRNSQRLAISVFSLSRGLSLPPSARRFPFPPPSISIHPLVSLETEGLLRNNRREEYTMIGSLLTRGLVMIFGYAYPAYECFKTVENNKLEIEQLRFWCQYWILVAVLTVCERIGDTFISWVPMYCEAKLAFYIYLWYPKTKGTTYVYDSFFKPYVAKHETEIDRNLMELRNRAGDMAFLYFQKAASYGQTRVFEILQYVAAQSTPTPTPTPRPRQNQPQQQGPRAARWPAGASNRQPPGRAQAAEPQDEELPSPASSTSSSQHQREVEQEVSSSPATLAVVPAPPAAQNPPRRLMSDPASSTLTVKKTAQQSDPESSTQCTVKEKISQPAPESSTEPATDEADLKQIESVPSQEEKANSPLPPQETLM